jgi:hypothetical protein
MSFPAFIHRGFNRKILAPIMPKLRTASFQKCFFTLVLTGVFCNGSVLAQDSVPDTKGELKDFRLDNPPPKDKPAEPAPEIEAPVAQPVVKSTTTPVSPRLRPAPPQPRAKPDTQLSAPPAADTGRLDENTEQPADVLPSAPLPVEDAPIAPSATAAAFDYTQYWPLIAAILAGLFSLAIFGIWQRRRRQQRVVIADNNVPARPAPIIPIVPIPPTTAIPSMASLTARFDPGDARLSVANLTVKGHLHLRYDGEAPLETLKLRTRVMSACDGQNALIDAFHSDPSAGEIESLGRVVPGEEIDLTLEMQVPRDALQAFDWRERRFVAPIVLINVTSEDGMVTPCRVSCVVGREGERGSTRLQPIPIDRGPKLFGTLQFRPIAA